MNITQLEIYYVRIGVMKMLNKKEYVEKIVRDILNGKMKLEDFVEEHFEIVEKIEWVKEEMTEPVFDFVFSTQGIFRSWYQGIQMYSAENSILKRKVSEYENPQLYKLEDLKPNMWVWDNDIKEVIHIRSVVDDDLYFVSVGEEDVGYAEFEENRFYSVTMALENMK